MGAEFSMAVCQSLANDLDVQFVDGVRGTLKAWLRTARRTYLHAFYYVQRKSKNTAPEKWAKKEGSIELVL